MTTVSHSKFFPKSTMKISRDTLDKLAKFGSFGDTYEDIVIKLMRKAK